MFFTLRKISLKYFYRLFVSVVINKVESDLIMTAPSPLRKMSKGVLYTRPPEIEVKLSELAILPQREIMARCAHDDENKALFIPSECLVYLVRANRNSSPGVYFEVIYKALLARVIQQLPPEDDTDITNSEIRSECLGAFAELLAGDRINYDNRLDYYEIRFQDAVATLRSSLARKQNRLKNRNQSLVSNPEEPESGELSLQVETAAGAFDPKNFDKYFGSHDRAALDAAISNLPELQIAILEMFKNGIPIYSKDPDVFTISKALDKSEKTIRLHRDQALNQLTAQLTKGEV
jgi:hypothetical protein